MCVFVCVCDKPEYGVVLFLGGGLLSAIGWAPTHASHTHARTHKAERKEELALRAKDTMEWKAYKEAQVHTCAQTRSPHARPRRRRRMKCR